MCYNIDMEKFTARNLLFPSLILAVALLVFCTHLLSTPNTAWAFSPQVLPNSSVEKNDYENELSSNFPPAIQQWKSEIEYQARIHGIDANMIAAVILVESGGDALAFSPCGAVGLMQVMPRNGLAASFTCNGQPCFSSRPSMAELFDPRFNIEFGSELLKSLFNRNENWREALFSYGPIDVGYDYADRVLSILDQYSHAL
jgi:soluble lytic murein transglycosylase-like protein